MSVIKASFGSGGRNLVPGGAQGDPTLAQALRDIADDLAAGKAAEIAAADVSAVASAGISAVGSADASDLATAITLVNELKTISAEVKTLTDELKAVAGESKTLTDEIKAALNAVEGTTILTTKG